MTSRVTDAPEKGGNLGYTADRGRDREARHEHDRKHEAHYLLKKYLRQIFRVVLERRF